VVDPLPHAIKTRAAAVTNCGGANLPSAAKQREVQPPHADADGERRALIAWHTMSAARGAPANWGLGPTHHADVREGGQARGFDTHFEIRCRDAATPE